MCSSGPLKCNSEGGSSGCSKFIQTSVSSGCSLAGNGKPDRSQAIYAKGQRQRTVRLMYIGDFVAPDYEWLWANISDVRSGLFTASSIACYKIDLSE